MKQRKKKKDYKYMQKQGKWMKLRLPGIAAVFLAFPVYGISNELFKLAVCRNSSGSVFRQERVSKLVGDINRRREDRKKKKGEKREEEDIYVGQGLAFADFEDEMEEGRAWFESQEKERITMTSHDGLKLVAYYLPAKEESRKVMILVHGYRNNGMIGDFSNLVKFYHEMGYHLLVFHQRAHGESEGKYICFGVKERFDLVKWTEYIARRFEGKCDIFLSGISMGSATVLLAAGLKLPEQVKGLIADCGYTSPWDIFNHMLEKNFHLPKFPFLYIADYICHKKAGFYFRECSTLESMRANRIPVLFVHGKKDRTVPLEMSRANYEACGADKELFIVDRAAHGTSNLAEPEAYQQKVMAFMEKCLKKD